jgi:hypothetical protein
MAISSIRHLGHVPTLLVATLLLLAKAGNGQEDKLDLADFAGNWEGAGQVVLPYAEVAVDVEGKATFTWDSANGYLCTAISATRFYLTYSDTGHFDYNPATNGVTWEIWNNWGKHVRHAGYYENGFVRGSRRLPEGLFEATLQIVNADSMHFRFTFTAHDSTTVDRAVLGMRRVKK